MIRHIHSLLCSVALAALVPARRVVGRSHTALIRAEARIATRKRRLDDRIVRDAWPLHVGVLAALLTLAACGPSPATRTAIDEANSLGARCQATAARIAETAPSLDEGLALLEREKQRCIDEARAFCVAHHLDCSEILP